MKFKITLKIDRKYGDLLPFNYQYEQSAVIYRILAQADTQYSSWLHENGYLLHDITASGTKIPVLLWHLPRLDHLCNHTIWQWEAARR